jgi:predicted DNA-binding transcriptional regulator YafY
LNHASNDFKLYRLNRLWELKCTNRKYDVKEIPKDKLESNNYFTEEIKAVIIFDEVVKHRLIEEYGIDSFTNYESHKLRFEISFTNKENLLEWILSFGNKAYLLEPLEIRKELKIRLQKMLEIYFES